MRVRKRPPPQQHHTPSPSLQTEGLAELDHSPSVFLLDAVADRLHALRGSPDGVPQDVFNAVAGSLKRLGVDVHHYRSNPGAAPEDPALPGEQQQQHS